MKDPMSGRHSPPLILLPAAKVGAGEILHLALPPIAFCMSGEGQIGPQKACADSPWSFPRLIRIASQVVAGGALVEFSTVAASR
jgi:hypothetical protein